LGRIGGFQLGLTRSGGGVTLGGMNTFLDQCPSLTSDQTTAEQPGKVSRRGFLGRTAGVLGAASLGCLGEPNLATAAAGPAWNPNKGIRVGMMTAPVANQSLDYAMAMAKRCEMAAMEVMSSPDSKLLNPMNFTEADADVIKQKLADNGLEISSLANYLNLTAEGETEQVQTVLKKNVDAAALLGAPTICTITGFPVGGRNRIQTIKEVVAKILRPVIDHAKDKGIKVAVENWFATCLQGMDTFDCLLETIPDENFGLNYDPSHLVHQELDIRLPVQKYSKRIFHTHAKDCLVDVPRRNYVGILGEGWWRYVIPGYGDIKWGEHIAALREVGYRGVLSIEHEDDTFGPEDGFRHGARYLNQFC
jgi:sugar phosphate isomerase/epimerase